MALIRSRSTPAAVAAETSRATAVELLKVDRYRDTWLSKTDQPSGFIEWDWMLKNPVGALANTQAPSGARRSKWGAKSAWCYGEGDARALVFDRTPAVGYSEVDNDDPASFKYPPLVADNQTFPIDFGNETVDEIAAFISFTVGDGAHGKTQRAVLIASGGWGQPSLAVRSVQCLWTPTTFGPFVYDADNIALGGDGQVFFDADGNVIAGEVTYASLGLDDLVENDPDDTNPVMYRISMRVDRPTSTITIDGPQGVLTYYEPRIAEFWHNRGTMLSWQIVRHTGCGDARFHALGRGGRSLAVAPVERQPAVPAAIVFRGGTDVSGGLTTQCPAWIPQDDPTNFAGLAGLAIIDPTAYATGTRQAIGPCQWSSDSKTFWWGLSHDQTQFMFAMAPDGVTSSEISSQTFTPAAAGTFYGVVWVYHPGTSPYTGANGSATTPAWVDWYTFPYSTSDGIGPLTQIGTSRYFPSGVGGVPFQRGSGEGALSEPPPLTIGRRTTKGGEVYAGRIKAALLFETHGRGAGFVDPVLRMPLVAGVDLRQSWETSVAITSTAPTDDSPDGTHNTLITLASTLKSAVVRSQSVTVKDVATATLANGQWNATPLTATTLTIPVSTASQGAGTGGTLVLQYQTGAGLDPARNRWTLNGSARYAIDGADLSDGNIPIAKLAVDIATQAELDAHAALSTFARKSGDQQLDQSSVALVNVTDLGLAVGANQTWIVSGVVYYDAATTADLKLGWTYPASSAGKWNGSGAATNATTATQASANFSQRDYGQNATFGGAGVGTLMFVRIAAIIRTAGTAGTLQLQAAQGTSDATTVSVFTDSFLEGRRVA